MKEVKMKNLKWCAAIMVIGCGSVYGGSTKTFEVKGKTVDRMGDNPLNMRTYSQKFTVTYPNAKVVKSAKLEKLPLYDGKKWAFSSRWDDNNKSNYQMRDLMNKYGYKGSFYLYSQFRGKGDWRQKHAKDMTEKGFSVCGHTMTHPKLPDLSKDKVFWEIAAIRLELEASTDYPVNSFAFSYGQFSKKDDSSVHKDIADALFRTGYHHNAYPWFVKKEAGLSKKAVSSVFNIRPGDRNTSVANFDRDINKAETSSWVNKSEPNMTMATHVWMKGKDWEAMEEGLKKYANRPDWWYCNQNEYAAYRYQFHHSKLEKVKQQGASVTYKLTLPNPQDLGESIPLSLRASGVVSVKGADCKLKTVNGKEILNVGHIKKYRLPKVIEALEMVDGKSISMTGDRKRSLPEIDALLSYDKAKNVLKLTAKNQSNKGIKNVQARVGLPLAFDGDDSWYQLGTIPAGKKRDFIFKLPEMKNDENYLSGKQFFFIQMDGKIAKKPVRIYAATKSEVK